MLLKYYSILCEMFYMRTLFTFKSDIFRYDLEKLLGKSKNVSNKLPLAYDLSLWKSGLRIQIWAFLLSIKNVYRRKEKLHISVKLIRILLLIITTTQQQQVKYWELLNTTIL